LLGDACAWVAELVKVYEGFGDRDVEGMMVACGGYVSTERGWEVWSPIWGISAKRAFWSLCSMRSVVVVVGGNWGVSFGMRISK